MYKFWEVITSKTKVKEGTRNFTALLSVATPDMTNIRRNVIMNSTTKAWA